MGDTRVEYQNPLEVVELLKGLVDDRWTAADIDSFHFYLRQCLPQLVRYIPSDSATTAEEYATGFTQEDLRELQKITEDDDIHPHVSAVPDGDTGSGWVGVDFDGTLSRHEGWSGPAELGEPIPAMVQYTRELLDMGQDVRIFTARGSADAEERALAYPAMEAWCLKHLGKVLPITNVKNNHCRIIYDDRAVQVERNTGRILGNPALVLNPIRPKA